MHRCRSFRCHAQATTKLRSSQLRAPYPPPPLPAWYLHSITSLTGAVHTNGVTNMRYEKAQSIDSATNIGSLQSTESLR